jgi:hypothetical protein
MGRIINNNCEYKATRRQNLVLPMRECAWILHTPYHPRSPCCTSAQDRQPQPRIPQISCWRNLSALVYDEYTISFEGSISFMNVIIDDEKKAPTLFPIFLFYLYLVWFVIFI